MKQDPTLYEPKVRFCEIISTGAAILGSAIIGGGLSLIGGSQAASAAENAAGVQAQSAREAIALGREGLGFQQEMFDVSRADLSPYRASGVAALGTMNDLFIPGGQSVVQMHAQLNELRAQRAVLARTGNQPPPTVQQNDVIRERQRLANRGAASQGEGGAGGPGGAGGGGSSSGPGPGAGPGSEGW